MRISDWSSDVCSSDLRGLSGFRRSSFRAFHVDECGRECGRVLSDCRNLCSIYRDGPRPFSHHAGGVMTQECGDVRSEEHTSELQSLMRISYAVFCLKKKNTANKAQS